MQLAKLLPVLSRSVGRKKQRSADTASEMGLIWMRLKRHKLAVTGMIILAVFYFVTAFAPFFSTHDPQKYFGNRLYSPPTKLFFKDANGFSIRPFFYGVTKSRDPDTLELKYKLDTTKRHYASLFVRGDKYKLFGLIPADIHLIGNKEQEPLFLFGTDSLGRDLFSRNIFAGQISLSVGLVGVLVTFVLGVIMGGISGYYGGLIDSIIQRFIEVLLSIPTIPLFMALSAAVPRDWSQIKIYFFITLILSITGWTSLARVVRGKLISMREEDYVMAAKLYGASNNRIIMRHLLPGFFGYLVVSLFMSIPGMILGETALSFLGLGLRPPTVSWGIMLNDAQNVRTIVFYPWVMIPCIFVVLAVLALNFIGDGLRDAADPYKEG